MTIESQTSRITIVGAEKTIIIAMSAIIAVVMTAGCRREDGNDFALILLKDNRDITLEGKTVRELADVLGVNIMWDDSPEE